MGFRSRALLTGVATGFLKANNDRHAELKARVVELADRKAELDRERAKSEMTRSVEAAATESAKYQELFGKGHIDAEGNYTTVYWDDASRAEWQQHGNGKSHKEYAETFKQGRPQKFVRQYKDVGEIQKGFQSIYDSIDARQRAESSVNPLTNIENMLGGSVLSLFGRDTDFEQKAEQVSVPTVDPMTHAAPSAVHEDKGLTYNLPKEKPALTQLVKNIQGKYDSIQVTDDNKVSVTDTGVTAMITDQNGNSLRGSLEQMIDPVWREGKDFVSDKGVWKNTDFDTNGKPVTTYGYIVDGKFVVDPKLRDTKVEDETSAYPFKGEHNIKAVNGAMVTVDAAQSAHRNLNIMSKVYNPSDYGSERFVSDGMNIASALGRIFEPDFSAGPKEQKRVIELIRQSDGYNQLSPELKVAIESGDPKAIKEANQKYAGEQFEQFKLEMKNAANLSDEDKKLLSELRVGQIDAHALAAARDVIRAWTNGDNKPALGAVQELTESLKPGATATKFSSIVETYKVSMVQQVQRSLGVKWSASEYSHGQSPDKKFLELPRALQTKLGLPGTELRRDPVTGDFLMIKTGIDKDKNIVRYYVTANDQSIYKAILPKKGQELTPQQADDFKYGQALEADFSERFNQHGRPY
jgi:hypothetical protein